MTKREIVRQGIAIEVEKQPDGFWQGWVYRKIGRNWFTSAVTSPYDTEEKARAAVLALPSREIGK